MIKKFDSFLNEGTWAIPEEKEERKTQGTIFIDKIEQLKDEIYPIFGDDMLFDCFDNAIKRIKELVSTPDEEIKGNESEDIITDEKIINKLKQLFKGTVYDKTNTMDERAEQLVKLHSVWLDKVRNIYTIDEIAEKLYKYEKNLGHI